MTVVNRVLAAEDSPTQATVLRTHLENAGFEISMARDGGEALALFQQETFDIVVSDVVMPGVDGYGLCRAVKDRDPGTPVILLTSMTDPLDVVHALEAGADNFLRKPYEPSELIHRVRNMLYNKELRQSGRTQIGLELFFLGRRFMINSDREQVLDLLVSTFEDLVSVNQKLRGREDELARANTGLQSHLADTELERERLQAVLAALPQGLAVIDADGRIVQANENIAELLGTDTSSLVGTVLWDAGRLTASGGRPIDPELIADGIRSGHHVTIGTGFDVFLDQPSGGRIPVVAKSAPVSSQDGTLVGSVVVMEDITELFAHDALTGLPGHGSLIERLEAAVELRDEGSMTGLLVVTVDRLERIREGLPSDGADAVIVEVVRRLTAALRSPRVRKRSAAASAAYLGNGEFAVVVPEVAGERDAVVIGELLVEDLAGPVALDSVEVDIGVSVGVGMCAETTDAAELVASVAASARQQSGRGGRSVVTPDPGMHAGVVARLQRESQLRRAIAAGELTVHYQPQIQLRAGNTVAAEALVRWEHPDDGFLGAGQIIPLAIESGLIAPLGWSVLEQACRQVKRWREELPGAGDLMVSVNFAAEQLAESDAVDHVEEVLSDTGLDPTALILELTETSVMEAARSTGERLRGIKALGVQLAIDDFGTGYSSLLQLRHLPIDILKIDRSFVSGMIDEPADAAIVAGTVSLARALGLELVAEGVETLDQLVQLRVLGCDVGQGYHWSPALPADEFSQWWEYQPRATAEDVAPLDFSWNGAQAETDAISYLIHELRSPLTAITGFADLLARGLDEAPPADLIDGIRRNSRELEDRLASVNEARLAEKGGITLRLDDVELVDLVQTLARDLGPQLLPHPVDVEGTGPVTVQADRSRLTQALTNLLTNAAKFSPGDTPIHVRIGSRDDAASIEVRDHGPGIPEHRRPELFRRFSRLGSRNKGMGVGLYLSRLIVVAHGGTLSYEPAPDGGSIFAILVPGTAPARGATEDTPEVGGAEPEAGRSTDREATPVSVVHIEDNIAIAQLLHKLMATQPDVEVHHAASGASGIALAVTHRPDLVLLDLNLPDLHGEEVLRRLRSDRRTEGIRVVVVSAEVTPTISSELEALGADGVLAKPFDIDDLLDIVDDVRRGAERGERPGGARSRLDGDEGQAAAPSEVRGPLDPAMVAALHEVESSPNPAGGLEPAVLAFSEDAAEKLRRLREALAAGDRGTVGQLAHALCGLAASFGAVAAAERCRGLVDMVAAGDLDGAAALFGDVATAVREAEEALHREFCRSQSPSES